MIVGTAGRGGDCWNSRGGMIVGIARGGIIVGTAGDWPIVGTANVTYYLNSFWELLLEQHVYRRG